MPSACRTVPGSPCARLSPLLPPQALLRHPGGLSLEQLLEAGGGPQEDTDTARALQQ